VIYAHDWSSLTVAGAFIIGAVAGTIATIRLTRYLLDYLKRDRPTR
jgi:hypothetical protein